MHLHPVFKLTLLTLALLTACAGDLASNGSNDQATSATNERRIDEADLEDGEGPETSTPVDDELSDTTTAIMGSVSSAGELRGQPLEGIEVRLAKVYWDEETEEGAFVIDEATSPTTSTDESGSFVFSDIEARDYVLVVGDLYGQNVIISEQDGSAVIYAVSEGQQLDIGELIVELEPASAASPATPQAYPPPQLYPPTEDD